MTNRPTRPTKEKPTVIVGTDNRYPTELGISPFPNPIVKMDKVLTVEDLKVSKSREECIVDAPWLNLGLKEINTPSIRWFESHHFAAGLVTATVFYILVGLAYVIFKIL